MIFNHSHIYRQLLQIISKTQKLLINKNNTDQELFADLLKDLLSLSESNYGFIGKIASNENQIPYFRCLAFHDLKNIVCDSQTLPNDFFFQDSNSLIENCVKNGSSLILKDSDSDEKKTLPCGNIVLDNFLGIPFLIGEKVIGMFGIGNRKGGYDQQMVDFLEPLTLTYTNIFERMNYMEQSKKADLLNQELLKKEKVLNQHLEHKKRRLQQSLEFMIEHKNKAAEDENRMSSMINSTSDIMFALDSNFCLTAFNKTFKKLATINEKSPKNGDDVRAFIPKSIFNRSTSIYAQVLTEKKVIYDISKIVGKNFFNYWEVLYNPIFNKFGEIEGVAIHARNIMERILAEQKLKENEQRLHEAQLSAKMGNWEYVFETEKIFFSNEFYEIFGIPKNFGETIEEFMPFLQESAWQMLKESVENLRQNGQTWDLEIKILNPQGEQKYVRCTGKGIYKNELLSKIIGTTQDITERKQIEEEKASLIEDLLQKNSDLAEFAKITSHNLRQPLTSILGLLELWDSTSTTDDFWKQIPKLIKISAHKLDQELHQMNEILTKKHFQDFE